MTFRASERTKALGSQLAAFMDEHIYPNERRFHQEIAEGDRWQPTAVIEELKPKARAAGLWNLFLPESPGGAGLTNVEYAPLCEIMGRSVDFAPEVFNCSAPDTGNMEVLARYGTEEQRRRWLEPLLAGEIRSCFAMTEPDVAGSDPTLLQTRAVRDGDDWVIDGTKLWISHGDQADLVLLFARTDLQGGTRGITAFLIETAWPGFSTGKKEKKMGLRGSPTVELVLRGLRVPNANVMGEVGKGFPMALSILDTGRIGIGSQAVGIADACLEASIKYARSRQQFGQAIADFGAIQEKIAEMATWIESARLLVFRAATLKDAGKPHRREASMAKLEASRCANFCAKEAVQIHGGAGYMWEMEVNRIYRATKLIEIGAGTSEVRRIINFNSLLSK
jgi:acyl-CoA dehydrogenase